MVRNDSPIVPSKGERERGGRKGERSGGESLEMSYLLYQCSLQNIFQSPEQLLGLQLLVTQWVELEGEDPVNHLFIDTPMHSLIPPFSQSLIPNLTIIQFSMFRASTD